MHKTLIDSKTFLTEALKPETARDSKMFWKCAQNLRNSKTFWTCAQDLHRITRYCRNPARKWWKQIISPEAGDFWFTNFKCWKFKKPTITLDDDTTMILEILGANFYSWWWKWWWWWWWWFAGSKYDQSATECSLCWQKWEEDLKSYNPEEKSLTCPCTVL